MHTARQVIGCHLTQETRVQHAFDDVASTIHESPPTTHVEPPSPCSCSTCIRYHAHAIQCALHMTMNVNLITCH